jgi:hypothetical protein
MFQMLASYNNLYYLPVYFVFLLNKPPAEGALTA